ncbi:NAD(P)-binding protein [Bimuria novae-zelandiae CBS 107.79]|uniref:NAD(P)-binding protein n=1 Tax=Bimuria novae-zelandiae CBS 107.79 TaxID=1447943 RepID=A0A6A5UWM6_9PLEO|nr:NAD(P)-binding protein [Bimuria novae-zelandiae CBS 107.79]
MAPSFPSFTKTWHTKPYPYIDPTRPELSAKGKNVVVTGGATGIGLAISVAFAKAGAKSVVIMGRRADKLEEGKKTITAAAAAGTTVSYKVVDLVKKEDTVAAFNAVAQEFGKIDVLIANASVFGQGGMIADLTAEGLMSTVELNAVTVLHSLQAFLPNAANGAVFIHSNTSMAHTAPWPGAGTYPLSKALALKLMDYAAAEHPDLRIISTHPCWAPTDLNGHTAAAPDSPDLAGHTFVWLASPEADFLKGKFVWSNWDAEELVARKEEILADKSLLTWMVNGVPA